MNARRRILGLRVDIVTGTDITKAIRAVCANIESQQSGRSRPFAAGAFSPA